MKAWRKKEKMDSRDFDGKQTKGSGNQWSAPGDIKNEDFLIECKQTAKKSYSLKKETWDKIAKEALFMYRLPMMSLQIQDLDLVVFSKEDFIRFLHHKKS